MQFSIIIPTLNEENFIGGILEDLSKQDFKDFEIVHVDAESKDKTRDIVMSYTHAFKVTSLTSEKRNVSHQKNSGALSAQGKYLIFIDADTRVPDPSFLSKIDRECQRSRCLLYMPTVEIEDQQPGLQLTFAIYNKAIEASRHLSTPIPSIGLAVFERAFFLHMGGYLTSQRQKSNKLFSEDYEIVLRAKKMGVTGHMIRDARFMYSLRRFKQDGYMRVVPKYILGVVEQLLGKEFIEMNYEMGGHLYDEKLP